MSENKVENNSVPTVEADGKPRTRCPKCLSIRRDKYNRVVKRGIIGVLADGTEYDTVTWRRTKCLSCGQCRIDMFHTIENKPTIPREDINKVWSDLA